MRVLFEMTRLKAMSNPMLRFIARRLVFLLITFIVALTIVFILPRLVPGSPIASLLARFQGGASPESLDLWTRLLVQQFGLDKPLYIQYLDFLVNTFRGDLGVSISRYPQKVIDAIFMYLPWTLALVVPSIIVSWIIGNLLGVIAGYKRKTIMGNILLLAFVLLSQIPYYWLGMLLLYVFAVKLGIFPLGRAYPAYMVPSLTWGFIRAVLWHYVLPFLSMVISSIGGWAFGMRVMSIYELRSDYMGYSESLGLPDRKLLFYVFRNAILPQITGLALSLGNVVGGAILVEVVFQYPGTGSLLAAALGSLDYTLIQGIFVLLISTLLIAAFIVDVLYAIIDPRVRLGYGG